jgi:hypothetical protein
MSNYKSYFLKSLGLREDQLFGGNVNKSTPTNISEEQLEAGIRMEMDHTKDPELAREIAMIHLTEDPQYYHNITNAGLAEKSITGKLGEVCPKTPMLSKLMSPTAIMPTPVLAVAVRGTTTGLLPAGGIVVDPVRARLGGFEPVQNLKPNSKGAIADTPVSSEIAASGGHYTPNNIEITGDKGPETNVKTEDTMHPMQVQQIGNEPIADDGTTRDGKSTPEAASAGVGDEGTETCDEPKKGVWGIEMDDEEEAEEVEIDVKEEKKEEPEKKEWQKPWEKEEVKESMEHKFKRLANIKEDGERSDYDIAQTETDTLDYEKCSKCGKENYLCSCEDKWERLHGKTDEAGALSEKVNKLRNIVTLAKQQNQTSPMLEKAEAWLAEYDIKS